MSAVGQAPAALGQVCRLVGRGHELPGGDAATVTGLRGHDDRVEVDALSIGQRGGALERPVELAGDDQQAARPLGRQRRFGQLLQRGGQRDFDVGLGVVRRAERLEAGQHRALGQEPGGQAERGQAGLDQRSAGDGGEVGVGNLVGDGQVGGRGRRRRRRGRRPGHESTPAGERPPRWPRSMHR